MKKSIVLLISLFFITALSALIIKNLDDTNDYITLQNSKINKIQLLSLVKNTQEEVSSIFQKNSENIDEVVNSQLVEYFPLKINDIDLKFKIAAYDKVNLNDLNSTNEVDKKTVIDFLNSNDVYNTDNLRYILKDNKITSKNQLEDVLKVYSKEIYDDKILEIKDYLGFLDRKNPLYELFIKIDFLNDFVNAYYVLDKSGGIKYFELSFK